ncbi:hypothetical protein D3C72_1233790 [compost metagenome]
MKKLMFVLGFLLMASTSMAAGLIDICNEKVDELDVSSLQSTSNYELKSVVAMATRQGVEVKICSVGALPVAILTTKAHGNKPSVRQATIFVPEMD